MTIDKSPQKIENMFNQISAEYDRNNNIISLGLHRRIKEFAVNLLKITNNSSVLDLFCGTGDIVSILLKKNQALKITGVDFSENMLDIARKKYPQSEFLKNDCAELPFDAESFDFITMSFGLRNAQSRTSVINESYRVLKPVGKLLHLDFGVKNIFSKIFDFITESGIFLFYKKKFPYKYLIQSKNEFPEPDKLIEEFQAANFKLVKRKDFLFGIISAQIFIK